MKKIPCIRNPNGSFNRHCRWIQEGGVPHRKYDGTACAVIRGLNYKRCEVKKGQRPPKGFIQSYRCSKHQSTYGWAPVGVGDTLQLNLMDDMLPDGTYEMCGPSVNGNPEGSRYHFLINHAETEAYLGVPRSLDGIKQWLQGRDIEGLVFHHRDGRMAKIRQRDFGYARAKK